MRLWYAAAAAFGKRRGYFHRAGDG